MSNQPITQEWPDIFTSAYRPTGTKTYRLASSQFMKPLGTSSPGYGSNGQNRSDDERRLFKPPAGYAFVQNDLESAESTAVALFCREGAFRDLVRLKVKPHNFMCVQLFPDKFAEYIDPATVRSFTPSLFKAHPSYALIIALCKSLQKEYDLAKRTVHGASYSMGWRTFRDTVLKFTRGRVLLTAKEAKAMLALFYELFPEIKEYQVLIEEKVKHNLPIANLFGHHVSFVARYTTDLARLAIAWGPQSTIGQCTNIAATEFQRYIVQQQRRWHLHNITHDSILASAPEGEAVEMSRVLAKHMTFTFASPTDEWTATIGVERQIGSNWGKHSTDNPNGLKVDKP